MHQAKYTSAVFFLIFFLTTTINLQAESRTRLETSPIDPLVKNEVFETKAKCEVKCSGGGDQTFKDFTLTQCCLFRMNACTTYFDGSVIDASTCGDKP